MEPLEILLLVVVGGLMTTLLLSAMLLRQSRADQIGQRLSGKPPSDPSFPSMPELVLGDMTQALASQVPMGQEYRQELQRELRTAGYYRPSALIEYAAVRNVLVIAPLMIAGILALFTDTPNQAFYTWMVGLVLAALGFAVPRTYLYVKSQRRLREIERGLPVAIDMLVLCLSAGLNIVTSLQRVVKELYLPYPVLAAELDIVRRQSELRNFEFALAQFANRTDLANIRNLSVILSQSEALGTDAMTILREYADNMRVHLKQRGQELANRAPLNLLVPAYLMVIGGVLLLIGPTLLDLRSFARSGTLRNTVTGNLQILQNEDRRVQGLNAPPAAIPAEQP